jgi:hypothetical protein
VQVESLPLAASAGPLTPTSPVGGPAALAASTSVPSAPPTGVAHGAAGKPRKKPTPAVGVLKSTQVEPPQATPGPDLKPGTVVRDPDF